MTNTSNDQGPWWIVYQAGCRVSAGTRDWLASKIAARHPANGTHRRKKDAYFQATLTIAYLRSNLTYAELAAPHDISVSTRRRYVEQGIAEPASRAIRLTDVVRLARKAGWEYPPVDGTLVPTVAFGRRIRPRQRHHSDKHRRHGVNVQTVCAPDGTLLWASAALPGSTVDITAARRAKIPQKVPGPLGLPADLGHLGPDGAITGRRRKKGQAALAPGQAAANKIHAQPRAPGERGNAQLKWWRVLATELRCRPGRATRTVKAVLALHHREQRPFTS